MDQGLSENEDWFSGEMQHSDEENGDEDNISETMQTIPQSTQKSTHPVAYFNESHPTQKI